MLTEQRIEGVIEELTEKYETLGDSVLDVVGPQTEEREDGSEGIVYNIYVESEDSTFYISTGDRLQHATLVYPYNIGRSVGSHLSKDDQETIIEEKSDWSLDEVGEEHQIEQIAGNHIIDNTPIEELWMAKFNLSVYASTALVAYITDADTTEFPKMFQCGRNIFPYTETLGLKELSEVTESVLIAGRRGKRYVETSLMLNDDGDPSDYTIEAQF